MNGTDVSKLVDYGHVRAQLSQIAKPFNGKKIVFLGDSWMTGHGWWHMVDGLVEDATGKRGISYILKENNPNAIIYNLAKSGAYIAHSTELGVQLLTLESQYNLMVSMAISPDYVIIDGGANDAFASIALGNIGADYWTYDEALALIGTVSGAFERYLYAIKFLYPNCKLGYIAINKIGYMTSVTETYLDRMKAICKKWAIPVCDLWNTCQLNGAQPADIQNFFYLNDSVHPTEVGYRKFIYPQFEAWLKTL